MFRLRLALAAVFLCFGNKHTFGSTHFDQLPTRHQTPQCRDQLNGDSRDPWSFEFGSSILGCHNFTAADCTSGGSVFRASDGTFATEACCVCGGGCIDNGIERRVSATGSAFLQPWSVVVGGLTLTCDSITTAECARFGDSLRGSQGLTPNQACCKCGGGSAYPREEEQHCLDNVLVVSSNTSTSTSASVMLWSHTIRSGRVNSTIQTATCRNYTSDVECSIFAPMFSAVDGSTAQDSCCSCGGGANICADLPLPSGQPWRYAVGGSLSLTCDNFTATECDAFGSIMATNGLSAAHACCICGGGWVTTVPTIGSSGPTSTLQPLSTLSRAGVSTLSRAQRTSTTGRCFDAVLADGSSWGYALDGLPDVIITCSMFTPQTCDDLRNPGSGDYAEESLPSAEEMTALDACCVCGGGVLRTSTTVSTTSSSLTSVSSTTSTHTSSSTTTSSTTGSTTSNTQTSSTISSTSTSTVTSVSTVTTRTQTSSTASSTTTSQSTTSETTSTTTDTQTSHTETTATVTTLSTTTTSTTTTHTTSTRTSDTTSSSVFTRTTVSATATSIFTTQVTSTSVSTSTRASAHTSARTQAAVTPTQRGSASTSSTTRTHGSSAADTTSNSPPLAGSTSPDQHTTTTSGMGAHSSTSVVSTSTQTTPSAQTTITVTNRSTASLDQTSTTPPHTSLATSTTSHALCVNVGGFCGEWRGGPARECCGQTEGLAICRDFTCISTVARSSASVPTTLPVIDASDGTTVTTDTRGTEGVATIATATEPACVTGIGSYCGVWRGQELRCCPRLVCLHAACFDPLASEPTTPGSLAMSSSAPITTDTRLSGSTGTARVSDPTESTSPQCQAAMGLFCGEWRGQVVNCCSPLQCIHSICSLSGSVDTSSTIRPSTASAQTMSSTGSGPVCVAEVGGFCGTWRGGAEFTCCDTMRCTNNACTMLSGTTASMHPATQDDGAVTRSVPSDLPGTTTGNTTVPRSSTSTRLPTLTCVSTLGAFCGRSRDGVELSCCSPLLCVDTACRHSGAASSVVAESTPSSTQRPEQTESGVSSTVAGYSSETEQTSTRVPLTCVSTVGLFCGIWRDTVVRTCCSGLVCIGSTCQRQASVTIQTATVPTDDTDIPTQPPSDTTAGTSSDGAPTGTADDSPVTPGSSATVSTARMSTTASAIVSTIGPTNASTGCSGEGEGSFCGFWRGDPVERRCCSPLQCVDSVCVDATTTDAVDTSVSSVPSTETPASSHGTALPRSTDVMLTSERRASSPTRTVEQPSTVYATTSATTSVCADQRIGMFCGTWRGGLTFQCCHPLVCDGNLCAVPSAVSDHTTHATSVAASVTESTSVHPSSDHDTSSAAVLSMATETTHARTSEMTETEMAATESDVSMPTSTHGLETTMEIVSHPISVQSSAPPVSDTTMDEIDTPTARQETTPSHAESTAAPPLHTSAGVSTSSVSTSGTRGSTDEGGVSSTLATGGTTGSRGCALVGTFCGAWRGLTVSCCTGSCVDFVCDEMAPSESTSTSSQLVRTTSSRDATDETVTTHGRLASTVTVASTTESVSSGVTETPVGSTVYDEGVSEGTPDMDTTVYRSTVATSHAPARSTVSVVAATSSQPAPTDSVTESTAVGTEMPEAHDSTAGVDTSATLVVEDVVSPRSTPQGIVDPTPVSSTETATTTDTTTESADYTRIVTDNATTSTLHEARTTTQDTVPETDLSTPSASATTSDETAPVDSGESTTSADDDGSGDDSATLPHDATISTSSTTSLPSTSSAAMSTLSSEFTEASAPGSTPTGGDSGSSTSRATTRVDAASSTSTSHATSSEPAPSTTATTRPTTTTEIDCSVFTCGRDCQAPCGWRRISDECVFGLRTVPAEYDLGPGCTTTHTTRTTTSVETSTSTTTSSSSTSPTSSTATQTSTTTSSTQSQTTVSTTTTSSSRTVTTSTTDTSSSSTSTMSATSTTRTSTSSTDTTVSSTTSLTSATSTSSTTSTSTSSASSTTSSSVSTATVTSTTTTATTTQTTTPTTTPTTTATTVHDPIRSLAVLGGVDASAFSPLWQSTLRVAIVTELNDYLTSGRAVRRQVRLVPQNIIIEGETARDATTLEIDIIVRAPAGSGDAVACALADTELHASILANLRVVDADSFASATLNIFSLSAATIDCAGRSTASTVAASTTRVGGVVNAGTAEEELASSSGGVSTTDVVIIVFAVLVVGVGIVLVVQRHRRKSRSTVRSMDTYLGDAYGAPDPRRSQRNTWWPPELVDYAQPSHRSSSHSSSSSRRNLVGPVDPGCMDRGSRMYAAVGARPQVHASAVYETGPLHAWSEEHRGELHADDAPPSAAIQRLHTSLMDSRMSMSHA
eukprot:m.1443232 g.1443232  ORF g.1443232 m.1443232 type:complete len:2344 (-) comp25100_c0_seq1:180-7211(-)